MFQAVRWSRVPRETGSNGLQGKRSCPGSACKYLFLYNLFKIMGTELKAYRMEIIKLTRHSKVIGSFQFLEVMSGKIYIFLWILFIKEIILVCEKCHPGSDCNLIMNPYQINTSPEWHIIPSLETLFNIHIIWFDETVSKFRSIMHGWII